jgi:hypothetical protein
MTKMLKTLGVLGALTMILGSAAQAQNNGSDFLIAGLSGSGANGNFTPGAGGNGAGGGTTVSAAIVGGVVSGLNGGSIRSPITGNNITGAAATNLGSLLGGNAAGATAVTNALTTSGVPAAAAAALVSALSGLGNNPTPAKVIAAANAFNALVANAGTSNAALNSPQVLAIHAALLALLGGIQ